MKNNVKKTTGVALLMALVVVLQFVGSMIPPIGGFSISLVLIPIVLGSAIYGPGTGAFLGGVFGAVVYINCITGADAGGAMVFQANPILCFFVVMGKGIAAGFAAGCVYKLLKKVNPYFAMLCAAIICPVVNTGVFVVCMLAFFIEVLSAWAGGGDVLGYIFTVLLVVNFLPELVINIVFSPAGQRIVSITGKK